MIISRPRPAHWFHLLAASEDLPQALAVLATRQGIEPQLPQENTQSTLTPELSQRLAWFQQLSRRYQSFWPKAAADFSRQPPGNPLAALDDALQGLEQWRPQADPLIQRLQKEIGRGADLAIYAELATHLQDGPLAMDRLGAAPGNWLTTQLYVLPLEAQPPEPGPGTIVRTIVGDTHRFLILVGPREQRAGVGHPFSESVAAVKGRPLHFPQWSPGAASQALPEIQAAVEANRQKITRLKTALGEINQRYALASLLSTLGRLQWFYATLEKVSGTVRLARVAGWTDETDEAAINHALQRSGTRAILHLAKEGDGEAPTILINPGWAKPFELFPRLLGVPGRSEADPSQLLFLIAPLMFGYMFGDIGQGLVLVVAGWFLRKRLDAAWLLIAGGISATLFGALFGSFFCREDLFTPLWLHPTSHPLPVLAIPLILGVLLILTGLYLDGLGHYWRGRWRDWLFQESGAVVLYAGAAIGLVHPAGWPTGWTVAMAGAAWYVVGNFVVAPGVGAFLGRLAHLLETGMQLGVNTLSFARIGAFALAHAGLSQAVITLAGLAGGGAAGLLILAVGNMLILLLEGLVVSVQTTRLILFEFFVRFLRGEGRPLRRLPPPPD